MPFGFSRLLYKVPHPGEFVKSARRTLLRRDGGLGVCRDFQDPTSIAAAFTRAALLSVLGVSLGVIHGDG